MTVSDGTKVVGSGLYHRDPKGTLVINDGYFAGEWKGAMFDAPDAKITLNGGTFEITGEMGPAIGVMGDNANALKNMLGGGCKYILVEQDNKEAADDDYVFVEGGNFATLKSDKVIVQAAVSPVKMYRLYNENSGEHFFTANKDEYDQLGVIGWKQDGDAWTAPDKSNTPVYRLYNGKAKAGYHHYTTSAAERDHLVSIGWTDEGIGWYSDDNETSPLFRLYNPNALGDQEPGGHHYTTSAGERDHLVSIGWNDEKIGWYGL